MTNTTEATESESVGTIIYGGAVNLALAIAKGTLAWFSGSASLWAEAVHSVADLSTEGLLLAGEAHGRKRERNKYIWSLIASFDFFAVGGLYSIWEGVNSLNGHESSDTSLTLGCVVLVMSILMELTSVRKAIGTLNKERNGIPWRRFVKETKNTGVLSLAMEDGADILGCSLALIGNLFLLLCGFVLLNGIMAILIGLLLVALSVFLARQNVRFLRLAVAPSAA